MAMTLIQPDKISKVLSRRFKTNDNVVVLLNPDGVIYLVTHRMPDGSDLRLDFIPDHVGFKLIGGTINGVRSKS